MSRAARLSIVAALFAAVCWPMRATAAGPAPPPAFRFGRTTSREGTLRGVLSAQRQAPPAGVYEIEPYRPGKVPVVLVHGLWSSPKVWAPMIDALRADPVLRADCQFWVVRYPSGWALPAAALSLRRSLREARARLDPAHADPALDQMVVLGKSTGGQTARLLVQSSGDALWNAVFARPFDQVRADPELRSELAQTFFFAPMPSIRRVIFVTTAHRGSTLARQPLVHCVAMLLRHDNPLHPAWAALRAANGPDVFQPSFRRHPPGAVDGLSAGSPLLQAIDQRPIAPGVAYHSIIAALHPGRPPDRMTDGFVRYASAHLDGAASERIVAASHLCEADPAVIAEVRRILHRHLAELGWPPVVAPPMPTPMPRPTPQH